MRFYMRESDRVGGADYLIPADENAMRVCEILGVEEIRIGSKEDKHLNFLEYDLGVSVEIYEKRAI